MLIKLSLGGLHLEYEGDETFFKAEVANFILGVAPYAGASQTKLSSSPTPASEKATDQAGKPIPKHSTDTVAKLLSAKTGPELILAAVAKKILVDGQDTVDRVTITAEMKKASSYYKKTYLSNLSNYLDGLTKADSLRLVSENVYGLPAKMRESLGPKLREQ